MAEAIMRDKVERAGLDSAFNIESAGTGDWHAGQLPDSRTIKVLAANGITKVSRARQVSSEDFQAFDHIIAMDLANERDLGDWVGSVPAKVSLMSSWNLESRMIEVPDPYYGSESDFHDVFKMLDIACDSLLRKLNKS
jgi:protein-tyrosine phosphatase